MAVTAAELTIKVDADTAAAEKGLAGVDKAAGGLGKALGGVAKIASGFVLGSGLMAAPGALLGMAEAAAADAASMAQLEQAVSNAEGSFGPWQSAMDDAISTGQALAFSDDDVRESLSLMTAMTGDAGTALDRLTVAEDLARGTGMDLTTASKLLGKVTDENVGVLKRYGITVGENATAQELMNAVDAKFGGQAAKFAESDAGKLAILKDRWGELQETIGYMVLPVLAAVTDMLLDHVLPALEQAAAALGPLIRRAITFATSLRQPLTKAFETLLPYLQRFKQITKDLRVVLAGPLAAAIIGMVKGFGEDGLAGVLPGAITGLQTFGTALANLATTALTALGDVDWAGVAGSIVTGIVTGFEAVTDFGSRFGSWATTQINAVDWSTLAIGITDDIATGWTTITDFGTRFGTWATTQFDAIDWAATAAGMLDGIALGWTTVTDFGTRFATWVSGQFASANAEAWAPTGEAVLLGIGTAILSLSGWGMVALVVAKIALWLKDGIGGGTWTGVATAISDNIAAAFEAVTGFGTRFVAWVQGQLAGADWSAIGTTIQTKFNEAMGALGAGDSASTFLQPLIDSIAGLATMLQPAFDEIQRATETFVSNLKPSYSDLQMSIDQLGIAWDNVKQAYMDTAEELGKHDWEEEKKALVTLATVGLGGVVLAARGLTLAVLGLSVVLRGLSELNNVTVVPSIKVLEFALDNLSSQVNTNWQVVSTAWNLGTGIPGLIMTGANAVVATIQTMATTASTVIQTMTTAAQTAFETMSSAVTTVVTTMAGLVGSAITGLEGVWSTAWGAIVSGAQTASGLISGSIGTIVGAIDSVISAASGIGSGFLGGLQSAYNTCVTWVGKIIGELERIPSWLRPGSPSKTMEEFGRGFVEGFVLGIQTGMPALNAEMLAYIKTLADTVLAILKIAQDGVAAFALLAAEDQDFSIEDIAYRFAKKVELLVQALRDSALFLTTDGMAAAKALADAAGPIIGLVQGGLEAFALLATSDQDFSIEDIAYQFAKKVELLVQAMGVSARTLSTEGLAEAKNFAEAAGPIVALVESGIAAFAALVKGDADVSIEDIAYRFAKKLELLVQAVQQSAVMFKRQGLAAAKRFADAAGPIVAIVADAAAAFAVLKRKDTDDSIEDIAFRFGKKIELLVQAIEAGAATFKAKGLKAARDFAVTGAAVFDLLKAATDFEGLPQFGKDFRTQLEHFFGHVTLAVKLLVKLGDELGKGLTEATAIARKIQTIIGLLTGGVSVKPGGGPATTPGGPSATKGQAPTTTGPTLTPAQARALAFYNALHNIQGVDPTRYAGGSRTPPPVAISLYMSPGDPEPVARWLMPSIDRQLVASIGPLAGDLAAGWS